MRLTYENTIYRIGFKHGQETRELPGLGPTVQDFTVATIRNGERDTENENIVASAKVHRFYRDANSLEAARKAALKQALKSMNATEAFRTAIWATYHSRPGGIKALPATSAKGSGTGSGN